MIPAEWLKAPLVLPGLAASSPHELVSAVADVLGKASGAEPSRIEAAFLKLLKRDSFSLGSGVAIPHTDFDDLTETFVCLVTLRDPLPIKTIDGRSPDIFLFILSKPDPHAHLLLLAHVARLAQSRTLLNGLRRSKTPEEILALVHAAEMRHQGLKASTAMPPVSDHVLLIVSIGGEKVVDALLIDLVDQGFGDACVLEGQSLSEAAAREVPLFAGFRDLFGDPGGRRILILEAAAERVNAVLEAVKRISQEHGAKDAHVSTLPIQTRWVAPRTADEETAGGH